MKNNLDKSLFYGRFFNEYQIKNGYISFVILFSIHKIYNKTITQEYLDIFKKNILPNFKLLLIFIILILYIIT